jgi:hypothetical protein
VRRIKRTRNWERIVTEHQDEAGRTFEVTLCVTSRGSSWAWRDTSDQLEPRQAEDGIFSPKHGRIHPKTGRPY